MKNLLQFLGALMFAVPFSNLVFSQTNTGLTVGSLPGSLDVTSKGALNYSVPIELPSGKGGLTPQLSIIYNSQLGDGIVGMGWSIAGLSAISRVPQTVYFDDKAAGVSLTSNDRFALDGNRLILTSTGTTYGADGATYGTEVETFSRITSYGNPDPYWFKVETKDGLEFFYGISDDSKLMPQGVWGFVSWMLTRIDDKRGNQIFFYYNNSNGEATISRIEYSGIKVTFSYEDRGDPNKYFIAGGIIQQTKRLISVLVEADGGRLREYKFTYQDRSNSQLVSVTGYGKNGEQLNPTTVGWGPVTSGFIQDNSFIAESGREKELYHGDFNGDGRCDFILTSRNKNASAWDKWDLYLANAGGISYTKCTGGTLNSDFKGFYIADVDNDGRMDALMRKSVNYSYCCMPCDNGVEPDPYERAVVKSVQDSEIELNKPDSLEKLILPPDDPDPNCCQAWCSYNKESFFFYTFNGTTLVRGSQSYDVILNNSPKDILMYAGYDFDADGKTDYLVLDKNKNYNSIRLSYSYVQTPSSFNNPNSVDFLDFNGDGGTDIMVIKDSNCKIYSINNITHQFDVIYDSGFPTKWHRFFLGDFNGDGKSDILSYTYSGDKTWRISLSNGKGFDWPEIQDLPLVKKDPGASDLDNNIYVVDLNSDGKSDILEMCRNYDNNTAAANYNYYIHRGNGIFEKESVIAGSSCATDNLSFYDRDGDGRVDLLDDNSPCMSEENIPCRVIFFHRDEKKSLVHSITDGFGRKFSISYTSLSKAGTNYTPQTGLTFPLMNYNGALNAVTRTDYSYPGLETVSNTFSYTAAVVHRQGKGLLGFKKILQTNLLTNTATETEFDFMAGVYQPMAKGLVVKVGSQMVSTVTNTNAIKMLDSKRYFAYIQKQVSTDALRGITNTVSYTYDSENLGNLTGMETQYGNDAREFISNTYAKVEAWCKSKLQSSTVTRTRLTPSDTHASTYTYTYYSNGLPYTETGMGLTTTYTYDGYGNLTGKSVAGTSVTGTRKVSYRYSSSGREVVESTDVTNATTRYELFPVSGLVKTKTLPNGKTVSYTYDGFGNLTSETSVTGITTTYKWEWESSVSGARTRRKVKVGSLPESTTWYDAYDRVKRTEEQGFNGVLITTTSYNAKGQVQTTTQPYYSGGTVNTTSYTYDTFGRITKKFMAGQTTSYSYSGTTTTVTSPGDVTVTKTDAQGNVLETTVNGQKVSNIYNALGKVKEVIPETGLPVKMEYDTYGFQTKLIDPSAGTVTYKYNALGELLEQTNAKAEKCNLSYDSYGRVTAKAWPGFSLSYFYHTSGGGVGNVRQISAGSVVEKYEYDAYGRLDSVMITGVGSGSYSYRYAYDPYGNTTGIKYPGGFRVNQTYRYGYLEEIKTETNTPIWKATAVNSLGMVTDAMLGPGVTQTKTFDPLGYPVSVKAVSAGNVLQHFEYSFNVSRGNLTYRKDSKRGLTENFSYDEFNRLTSSTPSSTGIAYSYTYDTGGNLTSKTGVGDYEYGNTTNIYAVTGISGDIVTLQPQAQSVNYTPFSQPAEAVNGEWKANFTYGPDLNRRQMKLYQSGALKETWVYFGGFEEKRLPNGEVYQHCYVSSPDGPIALFRRRNGESYTQYSMLKDYLGSVTALVGTSGAAVQEFSYDAWGRPRNPDDWGYANTPGSPYTNRGYTFHEQLGNLGLVNMNGRLYDPLVGRFLGPDNLVQSPGLPQSFNRYAYCLNNPLIYTDPDGEFWHLVIGAAIGGVVNWATHGFKFNAKGLGYFGVGALAGALGAGVGAGISSGLPIAGQASGGFAAGFLGTSVATTATSSFVSGTLVGGGAGLASGFTTGFGNALVDGKNFGQALGQGGIYGAIGLGSGALIGGIVGGIDAVRDGRDFWGGKSWETMTDYSLPNGSLPIHQQANPEVGCTQETLESIAEYKGQPINIADKSQGADFAQLAKEYGFNTKTVMPYTENSENLIGAQLKIGNPSAITYNNSGTMHTVGLNRIQIQQAPRVFGPGFRTRILIHVMDPLHNTYQNLSTSLFRSGYIRVIIP